MNKIQDPAGSRILDPADLGSWIQVWIQAHVRFVHCAITLLVYFNPRTDGGGVKPPPHDVFVDSEKTAARSAAKFCIAVT